MNIELPQATTGIEWCDHTANAWWGCTKVHVGCANCYAESLSKRTGHAVWGKDAPRRAIQSVWANIDKWNRQWAGRDRRGRVFCSSMSDLFERHEGEVGNDKGERLYEPTGNEIVRGMPIHRQVTVATLRRRLLDGIKARPNLVHLLLTKRPENVMSMVPEDWHLEWPTNVMIGTSPCNQATADQCIPELLKIPGPLFLSCEPLLGVFDLGDWLGYNGYDGRGVPRGTIDWAIVGGESGPGARPCDVSWVRSIVGQCRDAAVPVFVKQLGARPVENNHGQPMPMRWVPDDGGEEFERWYKPKDRKGGDPAEWPEDLRVRQWPTVLTERGAR